MVVSYILQAFDKWYWILDVNYVIIGGFVIWENPKWGFDLILSISKILKS